MVEDKKIFISYEELNDSKIDKLIEERNKNKQFRNENYNTLKSDLYRNKIWLYLIVVVKIASFVIWYLTRFIFKEYPSQKIRHDSYTKIVDAPDFKNSSLKLLTHEGIKYSYKNI